MNPTKKLKENIGDIDIYLLDQILKERFLPHQKILDAGCGNGRNLHWFYQNNFKIFGIDVDSQKIDFIKKRYPKQQENFLTATVNELPFSKNEFHHIICNAVLHFAEDESHFYNMFSELIRVLQPNGMLFIRMASVFGIEKSVIPIKNGIYKLPDCTARFLLTEHILQEVLKKHALEFLEPLKTVNVNNKRCMSTLILKKI